MNIVNSTSQSSAFGVLNVKNTVNKPQDPEKDLANTSAQNKSKDVEQNKRSSVARINNDEKAIAFFEQNQQSAKIKQENTANLDQPPAKNETAVASYQTIDNLAQRESVQQLFGVDVFA